MKTVTLLCLLASVGLVQAERFSIAGITFNEANAPRNAAIVEGPVTLSDHSSKRFGRYGDTYLADPLKAVNEFKDFDRSKSVGRLLGRLGGSDLARSVSFAGPSDVSPMVNVHRSALEFTWGESAVPNRPGTDLVIYEAGEWEGLAVAVRKTGSTEFTGYRYHFAAGYDKVHQANAVTFDFSQFGLAEGDTVSAVRVRNLFNSQVRSGGDKVDNASGEGWVLYPGDPRYRDGFLLRNQPNGKEFKTDLLEAEIIYLAALHDLVPAGNPAAAAVSAEGKQQAAAK